MGRLCRALTGNGACRTGSGSGEAVSGECEGPGHDNTAVQILLPPEKRNFLLKHTSFHFLQVIQPHYNLQGPPSYKRSATDQNVIMQHSISTLLPTKALSTKLH